MSLSRSEGFDDGLAVESNNDDGIGIVHSPEASPPELTDIDPPPHASVASPLSSTAPPAAGPGGILDFGLSIEPTAVPSSVLLDLPTVNSEDIAIDEPALTTSYISEGTKETYIAELRQQLEEAQKKNRHLEEKNAHAQKKNRHLEEKNAHLEMEKQELLQMVQDVLPAAESVQNWQGAHAQEINKHFPDMEDRVPFVQAAPADFMDAEVEVIQEETSSGIQRKWVMIGGVVVLALVIGGTIYFYPPAAAAAAAAEAATAGGNALVNGAAAIKSGVAAAGNATLTGARAVGSAAATGARAVGSATATGARAVATGLSTVVETTVVPFSNVAIAAAMLGMMIHSDSTNPTPPEEVEVMADGEPVATTFVWPRQNSH